MSAQSAEGIPAWRSNPLAITASLPSGARTRALALPKLGLAVTDRSLIQEGSSLSHKRRHAAKHALELVEGSAEAESLIADAVFPDRVFVFSRSLFDDGHSAPNFAQGLEIAQENDRIGQIGDIDRSLHVSDEAMLRHRQEGIYTLPVHVLDQLVHVQNERILLWHRGLIPVEAVDHD